MAYPIKDFKLADLFFYKDEESLMSIFILRDIPLKGTTRKQALETGMNFIEGGFEACEWMIDLNRNMFIYIDDNFYRTISAIDLEIDYSLQNKSRNTDTYMFGLLVTDMSDEYSKVVIITNYTVKTNSYNTAIAETHKWIEHEYGHFKQLEWYINERMQIHVI